MTHLINVLSELKLLSWPPLHSFCNSIQLCTCTSQSIKSLPLLAIAIKVSTTHTNVIYFPNARPCYYSHPDSMVMVSDCLLLDGDNRARLCRPLRAAQRKWV